MSIKKIHHEHDKIMKKILSNPKEATTLLNAIIQPNEKLKQEEIETEVQEGKTSVEEKEIFYNYIRKVLLKKLTEKEVIEFIEEIKNRKGVDADMSKMAVFNMLERENRMYINRGKIEGMTQKSMEIAKKLFEIHMTAEEVKQITGLTEKEMAKLKK